MKKMLVAGCSHGNGSGLPGEKDNPRIWANQLASLLGCDSVHNVARPSANNHFIFLETMSSLIKDRYDWVVVEWSAMPRFNFRPGLALDCPITKLNRGPIELIDKTLSSDWLRETLKRLLTLHNDHWDILDLVKYINTLIEIQVNARQAQIFFVNGLTPWSDQYFAKRTVSSPDDLDSYTHDLLQADLRDPNETLQLYDMIHSHYAEYGGIQDYYWLNLYASQQRTKIDTVSRSDGHPGYASQDMFANNYFAEIQRKLNGS